MQIKLFSIGYLLHWPLLKFKLSRNPSTFTKVRAQKCGYAHIDKTDETKSSILTMLKSVKNLKN